MTTQKIEKCEDALRLLAAHLDGELEGVTDAELRRHLSQCRSCYSRAQFEKRLKELVAGSGHAEVHPELRSRVRTMIEGFSVARPDSSTD